MNKLKSLAAGLLLSSLALVTTGCAAYRPLQIEPVTKAGVVIAPKFKESYYYYDRDHTLYFVMKNNTTDKKTGKPVEEIATFRIFWRPVGGRTSMNPGSLNATYRYVLMSDNSVGMYEGAGFVRLWGRDGAHRLYGRLMDGDLRLTEASANFTDTLGRSRVRGNFSAIYNDAKAFDMLLTAHQEFFARSLKAPSTQPSLQAQTQPWGERPEGSTGATQPATRLRGDGMQP